MPIDNRFKDLLAQEDLDVLVGADHPDGMTVTYSMMVDGFNTRRLDRLVSLGLVEASYIDVVQSWRIKATTSGHQLAQDVVETRDRYIGDSQF